MADEKFCSPSQVDRRVSADWPRAMAAQSLTDSAYALISCTPYSTATAVAVLNVAMGPWLRSVGRAKLRRRDRGTERPNSSRCPHCDEKVQAAGAQTQKKHMRPDCKAAAIVQHAGCLHTSCLCTSTKVWLISGSSNGRSWYVPPYQSFIWRVSPEDDFVCSTSTLAW